MKARFTFSALFIAAVFLPCSTAAEKPELKSDALFATFQKPTVDARPFVRWWWKGNNPTEPEIVRQLDMLHQAGFSGVHVIPIGRPAGGAEWLSPQWWRLVKFTADEAKKRGMQIDLNAGYGWPNGGAFVKPEHRIQALSCASVEVSGPREFTQKADTFLAPNKEALQKLVGERSFAFARLVPKKLDRLDQVIDVTKHVHGDTLKFTVPAGDYVLFAGIHRLGARRATWATTPDEYVVDYFDKQGVREYLDHFRDTAHAAIGGKLGDWLHAYFVASPEIWPANWTTGFVEEFRRRRGYDLMPYAEFATGMYPLMAKEGRFPKPDVFTASPAAADFIRRVRYDYNKTLVELFTENCTLTTKQWCHEQGTLFRAKSYGFPWLFGLAENYMLPDIPEGNNWLITDVPDHGWEVWCKYASAGGHLTGKHLISCEAMTTQVGKFRETLDRVKRADDFNFIAGITRSVFHGYCYSPANAEPPGWDQYGTFLSEHNPWWPYFKRWTERNARLSQVFQMSDPVVDVAILCPTADVWSDAGLARNALQQTPWYGYKLWESLAHQGLNADYLHEGVMQKATFADGRLKYGPMSYNALVLCEVETLEPETAAAIEQYVKSGGKLIVIGKPFARSPSLHDAAKRDEQVTAAFANAVKAGGKRVVQIESPDENTNLLTWTGELLHRTGMPRRMTFSAPSPDLFQVQYKIGNRDVIFFCNQNAEKRVSCRVEFPRGSDTPWRWDPETGTRSIYPTESNGVLPLNLAPGSHCCWCWSRSGRKGRSTCRRWLRER
jgi:alpha-L-rhamnosidase